MVVGSYGAMQSSINSSNDVGRADIHKQADIYVASMYLFWD